MSNSEKISVLIFNAISPKLMGGIKKALDELVLGFNSTTNPPFFLIGKKDGKSVSNFVQVSKEFLNYMKKVKVIHFLVLSPYNVPFIILAKLFRKKIISTYHGNNLLELKEEKKFFYYIAFWISDRIFRICSNIITSPTKKLIDQYKITEDVAVIPNIYNSKIIQKELDNNISKKRSEIILVTASNFDIKKKCVALEFLFDAMGLLGKKVFNVKLLVFGDGKILEEFREKYKKSKNIDFMGFRRDFANFLENSDAYLHITGLDNQPYSIIEAMMLEKVILCNEFDGIKETLEAENNYLVQKETNLIANGLYSMINEIQNDPDKFRKKGERNKAYAISRYSTDVIIPKYLEIYKKLDI